MQNEIQTEWDLKQLYAGVDDPQMEKDFAVHEKMSADFARKYEKTDEYLSSEDALLKALKDDEKNVESPLGMKPLIYLHYRMDLNSADEAARSKFTLLVDRYTKAENRTLFFEVKLSKVSPEKQAEFLASKKLAKYRYALQVIFQNGKHILTPAEEKISNLKSLPAHSLWVMGVEKVLHGKTVKWKGKTLSLGEAQNKLSELATPERRAMSQLLAEQYKTVADFACAEINAIVTDKKIEDELRGFAKPYSSKVLHYQNDEKTVEAMVSAVTKSFSVAHRFYKIKAKELGLKKLQYSDRVAPIGKAKKAIPFEQSLELVRKSFAKVDPKYETMLMDFFRNGQVDVFPKKGKTSGAYCSSAVNMPTFVLLNHIPSLRSVTTLAHEMGHAFHGALSKSQSAIYQDYTISVAEVASTLFENFVFDELLQTATPAEKKLLIFERASDSIQTVFRQVACFNFENELHLQIREKGTLSKEEIAALMNKHMHAYLGPVFEMKPDDGYFFVTWSHIRSFFYVYSYAYGNLISRALYAEYKKDKSFLKKIEYFLSAGGSKSPEDIFKDIGIDTSKPEFWLEGIANIEKDIIALEALMKK